MRKTIRLYCSRLFSRISYRMIQAVAVCVALLAGLLCCACGNQYSWGGQTPAELRIGVCIHNSYEEHVWNIEDYMAQWSREKEKETGIKITMDVVSSKGSQLTQNEQVEKFISKGYDVICVNLVDRTDPTEIIERAMDANIPVVFFNRELVKEDLYRWDKLFYVGANAEQAGRLQAEIILDAFADTKKKDEIDVNHNGTLQYVMLEGEPGHQDALIRTRVVTEELQDNIFIEKLGSENANWDADQAKTKMKALIERYPFQIEAVIANDDVMALGALDAITEMGYPNKVFVVGVNGSKEALEAVRSGKMGGSVFNDAKGQANAIMELAYSQGIGEPLTADIELQDGKYVYLNYQKITYDNVFEYLDETE